MGILTFDWSQILVAGNPLNIPWWAQVNVGVLFVVVYWMIVPLLYYTNVSAAWFDRDSLREHADVRVPLGVGHLVSASERFGTVRSIRSAI